MQFSKCLILGVVLILGSCQEVSKRVQTPRLVKCEHVAWMQQEGECSSFAGKVVATEDLNLGFRVAGIVEQPPLADGTFVRKGDVVARLDNRDYALQLAATQAEYDAIKAEVDRVVDLYAEKSVSTNDYDKATHGLQAITAKLKAHKNALADCVLRAPIDGYITKSNFGKGEGVSAGTPVVAIISASAPEITIDIPANSYLKQSQFEHATATVVQYGESCFNLKLKGVSPKGNLNQLYRVTFEVAPNEVNELPAVGMSAMVELNYTTKKIPIVEIPFAAVVEQEGKNSVWVVEQGVVKCRIVEISTLTSEGKCTLTSGLTAGETVVVAGVNSLEEGEAVEVLPKASETNIGQIK